jgi:serine/threonine protein phosphatase 1
VKTDVACKATATDVTRYLIIGDIHGCFRELQELLDRAALADDDQIVALGDIVDRGPDSPRVLDFFRTTAHASSLMGNHERKHVRSQRGEVKPALSQLITRRQIGEGEYPDACAFMASLPLWRELDAAVLVHGCFEPGVPLSRQRETVLAGTLGGERYLRERCDRPWYELYDGEKPLIVGHHDYLGLGQPLVFRDRVFGIDTGCCYGRRLTGILLPEFRIISATSRHDYWARLQHQHADIRDQEAPLESLTWQEARELVDGTSSPPPLGPALPSVAEVSAMLTEAERLISVLHETILRTNADVLTQLRGETRFDELSVSQQGTLYAARIGYTPLLPFLHRARQGELNRSHLRDFFKRPAAVIKFGRKHGVGHST